MHHYYHGEKVSLCCIQNLKFDKSLYHQLRQWILTIPIAVIPDHIIPFLEGATLVTGVPSQNFVSDELTIGVIGGVGGGPRRVTTSMG